jgi:WD40 repeat protein
VSRFNSVSGAQGTAGIPTDGSTMTIATNKIGTDTFVFDPASNSFRYLRTNAAFDSSPGDITTLLSLANTATPLMGGGTYNYAEFNVGSSDDFLYLIWDLRKPTEVDLCFSDGKIQDACCKCTDCESGCSTWRAYAYTDMYVQYYDCSTSEENVIFIESDNEITFCAMSWFTPRITQEESGEGTIELLVECGCEGGREAIKEPIKK